MAPGSKTKQAKYEYPPSGTKQPTGIAKMRVHTEEKLEPRGRVLQYWTKCSKVSQTEGNKGCFFGYTDFWVWEGGVLRAAMICKRRVCDREEEHEDADRTQGDGNEGGSKDGEAGEESNGGSVGRTVK
ncbi:hypothetical protein HII31_01609 [Pseudocercospora fuligena]|uniref:Uncharacterized protein n=1 Tax=Pseudocercospora fuligena TaxID=685502 RepID=A0A8H6RTG4_9PEZI|nr:hypothetical protein HII31_01609 [Pseudocercospora fuligena]